MSTSQRDMTQLSHIPTMARTKQGIRVVFQGPCSRQMMATRAAGRTRDGDNTIKMRTKRSIPKKIHGLSVTDLKTQLADILVVLSPENSSLYPNINS